MGVTYAEAKAAVLARNDAHMETCEYCAPYVEELIKAEMENRADSLAPFGWCRCGHRAEDVNGKLKLTPWRRIGIDPSGGVEASVTGRLLV